MAESTRRHCDRSSSSSSSSRSSSSIKRKIFTIYAVFVSFVVTTTARRTNVVGMTELLIRNRPSATATTTRQQRVVSSRPEHHERRHFASNNNQRSQQREAPLSPFLFGCIRKKTIVIKNIPSSLLRTPTPDLARWISCSRRLRLRHLRRRRLLLLRRLCRNGILLRRRIRHGWRRRRRLLRRIVVGTRPGTVEKNAPVYQNVPDAMRRRDGLGVFYEQEPIPGLFNSEVEADVVQTAIMASRDGVFEFGEF
mmetsp:Transcript_31421/g.38400  ORF Transcript_31421/g.38400 Transcript_31421/m.38400 type:complete len:252 (+) Transcript_31421:146-901(+)